MLAINSYSDWGNVEKEDEVLKRLLDNKKIEETEINREEKTITIGSKVIDYSVEIYNPYEIKTYGGTEGSGNCNYIITLFNKDTGEYEAFGERIVIEGESEIFEGNVLEYMKISNDSSYGYPEGTSILFLPNCPFIENIDNNVKITIYIDDISVIWEGRITLRPIG